MAPPLPGPDGTSPEDDPLPVPPPAGAAVDELDFEDVCREVPAPAGLADDDDDVPDEDEWVEGEGVCVAVDVDVGVEVDVAVLNGFTVTS